MEAHGFTMRSFAFLEDARNQILSIDENGSGAKAAVKSSVSAVETFLNEFCQFGIGYEKQNHSIQNPMVKMAKDLEKAEASRASPKKKVQVAYEALSGERFKKGSIPEFQRFSVVVDVRNELTHPKASVLNISVSGIEPQKFEKLLIKKLKSNGFGKNNNSYDWVTIIDNKDFALWAYQACIGVIGIVIEQIPYKEAIESYKEMYSVNMPNPKQWPNKKFQVTPRRN